jgi:inner membrane protein
MGRVDTLTHALSGALLARATARKEASAGELSRRVAAGFFSCAAPDLDFVYGFFGPVQYVLNHRGPTHSILLAPFWAFLVAALLAKMLRAPGGWREFYGISAIGIGAHIAGDVITSYGTMILAPLSDWRAAIGTTFIIDLWFSGIIVAGLVFSIAFIKEKLPSIVALAVLAGYVGCQGFLRHEAIAFGERYAAERGLTGARVTVHPRPVSPFNWSVFVSDGEMHHVAHVNLVRSEPRRYQPGEGFIAKIDAPYLPLEQAAWTYYTRYGRTREARALARAAWGSPPLEFFRWFADVPAFDGLSEGCVWFVDLRFFSPGRDVMPFQFGACRSAPGARWRAFERRGPGLIEAID